jgi:hypothetical protein
MIEDAYIPAQKVGTATLEQLSVDNYISVLQDEIKDLRSCMKNALLIIMHYYSMITYGESWAEGLDIEGPKNDQVIYNMAKMSGVVPYWKEGEGLRWREFREFRNDEQG